MSFLTKKVGDDIIGMVAASTSFVPTCRTVEMTFESGRVLNVQSRSADLTVVIVIESVGSFVLPADVRRLDKGIMIWDHLSADAPLTDQQFEVIESMTVDEIMLHGCIDPGGNGPVRSVSVWGMIDLDRVGGLLLRSKSWTTGRHRAHLSFQTPPQKMSAAVRESLESSLLEVSYE